MKKKRSRSASMNTFIGLLLGISVLPFIIKASEPRQNHLQTENTKQATFNVSDHGASGIKEANVQSSIRRAIDDCAEAGGGMVCIPPGDYTTGTLHLRSYICFHVEAYAAQAAQPVRNSRLEIPVLSTLLLNLRLVIHPSFVIFLTDYFELLIYSTEIKNSPLD